MGKNVFLFELDSVRMTDEEIIKAQKTMYDEIVAKGNTVVMTYNQVVDSRGFFCLLNDKKYYDSILRLFEIGRLKVSQFRETRTLTQYLLNSLEDNKQFIYSALPIKYNQKRLIALIKRSLIYTDLSEIYEYFDGGSRTEAELNDLFIELNNQREENSRLSLDDMRIIIRNLYWMLSAVMRLSSMHNIYLPPRERSEYKDLLLYNYLQAVMTIPREDELWRESIEIIKELPAFRDKIIDRSVYLREIKEIRAQKGEESSARPYQYAEAIINACYNYACEASVCNISKHYNSDEITAPYNIDESTTFYWDFLSRLSKDWDIDENKSGRYMADETNSFVMFSDMKAIPDFSKAVRLTEYINREEKSADNSVYRYEYNSDKNQKKYKNAVRKRLSVKILSVLLFLAIAFIGVLFTNDIQKMLGESAKINGWILNSAMTVAFMLFTEGITMIIKKWRHGFMTLSEALNGLFVFTADFVRITCAKSQAYFNTYAEGVDYTENRNASAPIDFVRTSEIKKYIKLFNSKKGSGKLFAPSDVYPIYDVENNDKVRELLRNEEIYHRRYGVIYQSPYNTLLVDPIEAKGNLIPYERMTPSSGFDGVVVIAKHNDNFILLKQFRHALRDMQFSFVRGYAECGNPVDDVKRELKEEIGVTEKDYVSEPSFVGRIAADSGLATTKAYVYCVELKCFDAQVGHEGIKSAIEISREDFTDLIHSGQIDDGYTLGAYALSSL